MSQLSHNNTVTRLFSYACKLVCSVVYHVDSGRVYSSITQNLKFGWSIWVTGKSRALGKPNMFQQEKMFTDVTPNLTKISATIFSYPKGSR